MSRSILDQLAALPVDERRAYLEALEPEELDLLVHGDWSVTGRPEQFLPDGVDWLIWLIRAGRGWGKLLDVDTPIPTPTGWTRLGDITPGDLVYDETGTPCTVTATHDDTPERAWTLRFSDGAELIAGGEHRWVTWTNASRKAWNRSGPGGIYPPDWHAWRSPGGLGPEVVDTDTIAGSLDARHTIPTCQPLHGHATALQIDPWALGAWLGDGATHAASITCHEDDAPHFQACFAAAGYPLTAGRRRHDDLPVATYPIGVRPPARDPQGRMTSNGSFHSLLREEGLLGAKRIPSPYLRAPRAARLALLRGLMDTDGYAETSKAEFTTVCEDLADQVLELVRSLGERPAVYKGTATLDGIEVGPKWRIVWRPARHNPFSLPRKAERIPPPGAQASRLAQRVIVACEPAQVRPMRCLTVDSPSHLFLAGDAMIPTHNTKTGSEATKESILQLEAAGVDRVRWALLAPRESDVLSTMLEGETGLASVLPPSMLINGSWEDSLNRGKLRLTLASGAMLQGFSGKVPANLRGPQHHGGWVDEPATLPDAHKGLEEDTAMSNLLFGLRLKPWNRLIITGTPRNVRLIRELREMGGMIETHGRTRDNLHNLSATFKRVIVARYLGTRLGRQELDAEILEGVGVMFARGWFPAADPTSFDLDDGTWDLIRMWDLAATEPSDMAPDPDWTAGALVARRHENRGLDGRLLEPERFIVVDMVRDRLNVGERDDLIRATADADAQEYGINVQWFEREPGASGKSQITYMQDLLRGIARAEEFVPTGPKGVRAELSAGPAQQGKVELGPELHGPWHLAFLDEHEEFHPEEKLSGPHDDQVDSTSAAFAVLLDEVAGQVVAAPAGEHVPSPTAQRARRGPVTVAAGVTVPRPRHRNATTPPRTV